MIFLDLVLKHLGFWHYLVFFIVVIGWILLLLLTILLRKNVFLLIVLSLSSFLVFIFLPLIADIIAEKFIFKKAITQIQTKQLKFINKTIIKAKFSNLSFKEYKQCDVLTLAFKKNQKMIKWLKEFKKPKLYSITPIKDIPKSKDIEFFIDVKGIENANNFSFKHFAFCEFVK